MDTNRGTTNPHNAGSARPYDAIVIGGGQAGLAMGYYLAHAGLRFTILDAGRRIGQAWEERYDSLRLFTPAEYNGLPGMPYPAPHGYYPTKDEAAAYLRSYARHFALPVWLKTRVTSLVHAGSGANAGDEGGLFHLETSRGPFAARRVIVATGPFQRPHTPDFAARLAPDVFQIHSAAYRNPSQLPPGDVLIVGAGNSGAQIAEELSHREDQRGSVSLAVSEMPPRLPQRLLGRDILWWLEKTGLLAVPAHTRLGQRLRRANPLIGTSLPRLLKDGRITLRPRVSDADGRDVVFADGTPGQFVAIVWATGYRPDYSWLHVPVLDERGTPVHTRGVTTVPGLYFLGLYWQHRRDSALLGGVKRDAAFLAEHIGAGTAAAAAPRAALTPQPA